MGKELRFLTGRKLAFKLKGQGRKVIIKEEGQGKEGENLLRVNFSRNWIMLGTFKVWSPWFLKLGRETQNYFNFLGLRNYWLGVGLGVPERGLGRRKF